MNIEWQVDRQLAKAVFKMGIEDCEDGVPHKNDRFKDGYLQFVYDTGYGRAYEREQMGHGQIPNDF